MNLRLKSPTGCWCKTVTSFTYNTLFVYITVFLTLSWINLVTSFGICTPSNLLCWHDFAGTTPLKQAACTNSELGY